MAKDYLFNKNEPTVLSFVFEYFVNPTIFTYSTQYSYISYLF